jgi:hypothetical protein
VNGSVVNWISGTINSGASLTVASNAVVNWKAGQIYGAVAINPGGAFNMTNNTIYYFFGTLTNNGTVTWSAGTLYGYNGALIYNAGLWDAQSDNQLVMASGTPNFINAGTFRKSGGAGTTTIGWPFGSSATIDVRTGTLSLANPFVQTAGLTLLEGGNLLLSQGYYLRGGTLAGTNTVFGSITNNGVVSPGLSPGKLTISGNYKQTTNGTLNIELAGTNAGTNFDLLVVTGSPGTANLAGTLNVGLTNGFYPATNAAFIFIKAVSVSNTFGIFNYPSNDVGMTVGYTGTNATIQVINVHPVLPTLDNQTVNEQTLLSVNAAATDADTPPQTLIYALTNSPSGASVNSSGLITWTPTETNGPTVTNITVLVTDNGTPNLTVSKTFQVTVNEVNVAPMLFLPANQVVDEQTTINLDATATDSDVPANSLTFALVSGPSGLTVSTNGAISWMPAELQGPSTNTVFISVTDTNAAAVNATSLSTTNSFQIIVNEVNVAPVLFLPPNTNINEQVAYSATATATDADFPVNALNFALVSGPSGLTVSSAGVINWMPAEDQGPSTNTVTITVTDSNPLAVNATSLSVTNSYQIIVSELNVAPVLTVAANTNINELTTLTVTNTATDSDIPANALTFSLLSPLAGMAIDATNGVFTWSPTEAQGPGTNTISVVVTDTNAFAVNGKSLSTTNTFTVIVNESNSAPVLGTLTNYTVNAGQTVSFTATATDSDVPANTLTFSLVSPPGGASINSGSGLFNWRPAVSQANTTNTVQVQVTDFNPFAVNSQHLSDTKSFKVVVNPLAPVVLTPTGSANGQFEFQVNGTAGPDYIIASSTNLSAWNDIFTNLSPTMPFQFTNTVTFTNRFFRARLSP